MPAKLPCEHAHYHNDHKFSDRKAWANSVTVDPDQTAHEGAVRSSSALFVIPSASFGHMYYCNDKSTLLKLYSNFWGCLNLFRFLR